jgi:CysZ protein
MNSLFDGFQYVGQGFKLLTKSGLKRYVIIPLMINVLLFIGFFFVLRYFVVQFNEWFTSYLPAWLHWLSIILWLLFFVGFFVIIIYCFLTIANIVSAPFLSFLSEKVEFYLTGKEGEQRSLWENIRDVPRIMGRQLTILLYYLPRALIILILFFVPIIHFVAPIIAFLFHAWYMSFTYIDYPTDNHRIPIRKVRTWLNERMIASFGFGSLVLLISMVPVLNFFILPAATASATVFWIKEQKK